MVRSALCRPGVPGFTSPKSGEPLTAPGWRVKSGGAAVRCLAFYGARWARKKRVSPYEKAKLGSFVL